MGAGWSPLGGFELLMSLSDSISQIMLNSDAGRAELAVCAALGFVVTAGTAPTLLLDSAATSRIRREFADPDAALPAARIPGLVPMSSLIGAGGLVSAMAVGEPFQRFAFGPEFVDYSTKFTPMAVCAWMVLVFAGLTVVLVAARQVGMPIFAHVLTMAAVLVSGFVLVPEHGLPGAVISLLIGGAVKVLSAVALVATPVLLVGESSNDQLGSSHG